jgi:hypothetical protein
VTFVMQHVIFPPSFYYLLLFIASRLGHDDWFHVSSSSFPFSMFAFLFFNVANTIIVV